MKLFNTLKKLLLPLALLCAMTVPGVAQTWVADPPTQAVSAGVDPATLNVNVTIPIVSKSGLIPFSTSLVFNNNFWGTGWALGQGNRWVPRNGVGWFNTIDSEQDNQFGNWVSSGKAPDDSWCPLSSDGTVPYKYVFIDGMGEPHAVPGYIGTGTNTTCTPLASSVHTLLTDGSGMIANLSVGANGTITTKDGKTITPGPVWHTPSVSESVTDTNGNSVSGVFSSTAAYTDSLGVQELVLSNYLTTGHNVLSWSTYTYPTSTGTASVTVALKPYTIETNFGCSGVEDYSGVVWNLADTITLGDGFTYSFTYESQVANTVTGRLASVTYPNGAVVSYTYTGSNGGINCADGTTAGLTVTTAAGTTTYTRDSTFLITTVTSPSPASNKTVYTFVRETVAPKNMMLTQVKTYQGSSTLLETTQYCYNTNQTSCSTTAVSSLPITQMDTYKLLAGMSSSNRATVKYDNYGNMTEKE